MLSMENEEPPLQFNIPEFQTGRAKLSLVCVKMSVYWYMQN